MKKFIFAVLMMAFSGAACADAMGQFGVVMDNSSDGCCERDARVMAMGSLFMGDELKVGLELGLSGKDYVHFAVKSGFNFNGLEVWFGAGRARNRYDGFVTTPVGDINDIDYSTGSMGFVEVGDPETGIFVRLSRSRIKYDMAGVYQSGHRHEYYCGERTTIPIYSRAEQAFTVSTTMIIIGMRF